GILCKGHYEFELYLAVTSILCKGNFVVREGNVFEEIGVDESVGVLEGNERNVLEKNEVIVLEDSEEENEETLISAADEVPTAYEG
ncbi:9206_t:CDS:2, partial [Dentiscutata erythropus]